VRRWLCCPPPSILAAGTAQRHKEERGAQRPRVSTSLSPTPQELKHKILLKGKKIGRLEDTLDGPGDEAPDVSDDDNGAEAEEERRRMKVGGLGWGLSAPCGVLCLLHPAGLVVLTQPCLTEGQGEPGAGVV